eukprot:598447-Pyramimonas_sp.AAC.1
MPRTTPIWRRSSGTWRVARDRQWTVRESKKRLMDSRKDRKFGGEGSGRGSGSSPSSGEMFAS